MTASAPQSPIPNPQSQARPRLAFAGLGWIGKHRMNAVAQSGLAEIAYLCDPADPATCSFDEILQSDADAVVIATPSGMHAEQTVAALERGKAVFCQKPLGRNAAETRRVVEAARANDRLLGVDLSYRFTDAMRAVRKLVADGTIGNVYAVDLVFHNAYGPDKPWFYDRAQSGGGCVIDLGIHLADMALWTLGFPRVEGVKARLFHHGGHAVEDYATALIDLSAPPRVILSREDGEGPSPAQDGEGPSPSQDDKKVLRFAQDDSGGGIAVQLACSWNLSAGRDCVIGATFYGTRGAAAFRNVDGSFYDFVAEHYEKTKTARLTEPGEEWGGRAIVDWTERLARRNRFDPEIEQVIAVAELLDAIYRSGAR